jgi:predicted transposase YbfD/YdcC
LVLNQTRTQEKSNEIIAIPILLKSLELKEAIIAVDAVGTQKNIASHITRSNNKYVLAVKHNQKKLYSKLVNKFDVYIKNIELHNAQNVMVTEERGHGRIEKRSYYYIDDIKDLNLNNDWSGITSIGAFVK